MSSKTLFTLLAAAGLLAAMQSHAALAQVAGPGVGGFGNFGGPSNNPGTPGNPGSVNNTPGGGGGGNVPSSRICITVGGDKKVCFYPRRPPAKYFQDSCCWRKVVKKRLRINGQWRTVYVDKGGRCAPASGARQCARLSRR